MKEQALISKIEKQGKIFKSRAVIGHADGKRHDAIQPDEQKWMWTAARKPLGWSPQKIGSVFNRDPRTVKQAIENYERNHPPTQQHSEIPKIIKELEAFTITIGSKQTDAATILQKIWGGLSIGKIDYEIAGLVGKEFGLENAGIELFNATYSVLARLSLYNIVDKEQRLMPNGPRPSYHQTHWFLTDFGKEVIRHFARPFES